MRNQQSTYQAQQDQDRCRQIIMDRQRDMQYQQDIQDKKNREQQWAKFYPAPPPSTPEQPLNPVAVSIKYSEPRKPPTAEEIAATAKWNAHRAEQRKLESTCAYRCHACATKFGGDNICLAVIILIFLIIGITLIGCGWPSHNSVLIVVGAIFMGLGISMSVVKCLWRR